MVHFLTTKLQSICRGMMVTLNFFVFVVGTSRSATTFSTMTLSVTTFSITITKTNTHHNDTQHITENCYA
jgi:hypothetical protein